MSDSPNNNIQPKPRLTPGQRIGHYEIIKLLGEGGMGEVYLAEDRKLGRKVALKFLPSYFTEDEARLRRFAQEARAASALNHPNIITIHEIGEAQGRRFIATEFIDGETLRHRIATATSAATRSGVSQPKLGEILNIAEQIASALAAAHATGIVHRDLKPENIMLRPDGYIKVLDFGLAKLTEQKESGPEDPTRELVNTSAGTVMGTVAYMSPEQARGLPLDARTDIWSLGVVLYEMITGRAPFAGQTNSDVMVSVLEREPPRLASLAPETPETLEWIVMKALTKDRDDRYQTARELLNDLRRLVQRLNLAAELERSVVPESSAGMGRQAIQVQPVADTGQGEPARATLASGSVIEQIKHHKATVPLALLIAVAAVGGIYSLVTSRRSSQNSESTITEAPHVLRTTQVSFSSGLDIYPALSPDGNSIAYSSDQSGNFEIYVKQLTIGGREIQLTSDGQQNFQAAWSPDGQRLAYYSKNRGGIWLIPAFGGVPRQLTQFGSAPAWSHDGSSIAFQSDPIRDVAAGSRNSLPPSTIWIVSSQGEMPRQLTQIGSPSGGHGAPSWSPDGNRIVFAVDDFLSSAIWSVSVKGDDLKRLSDPQNPTLAGGTDPVYSPDGESIYYVWRLSLWNIRVSQNGESLGQAAQVAQGAPSVIRHPTISANGKKIAYAALAILSDLWSLPVSPGSLAATGAPTQLTVDRSQRHVLPVFSPEGKKIAFGLFRVGPGGDVWMVDADGKNPTQLTTDPAVDNVPSWFPEGDRIAFLSNRDSQNLRLWSSTLVSGREQLLLDLGPGVEYARLSPDGKRVAFNSKKSGYINIWTASLDGGPPTQLTFDKELAGFPCWSPDGQFIAFEIKRGDDNHLMIVPSVGGTPTQLTLENGLSWPHDWSPDGDKIAFAGFRNGYWNVYWVSRTTREQKQLTNYKKLNAYVRYPAWSPLGNQIVYEYAETTGNVWLVELK